MQSLRSKPRLDLCQRLCNHIFRCLVDLAHDGTLFVSLSEGPSRSVTGVVAAVHSESANVRLLLAVFVQTAENNKEYLVV